MKKALLVTIFRVPNYGSVLQTYATQRVIESLGYGCCVLNYDHNKAEWAKVHGVKSESIKNKICMWLGLKASHRKSNKLTAFINKHLHLTKKYFFFRDIQNNEGCNYDVYVADSDQIWNTKYTNCDPVFLLEFADDSKRKISVASSFACSQLDARYVDEFKSQLSRFNKISVREELGINVLKKIGIYESYQVLDPTLLLDSEQWNSLKYSNDIQEKYILLYMWCYAFEPRPYIYKVLKEYQQKLKCKIIVLEGYSDCSDEAKSYLNMVDATDSSISDFLSYFSKATLVVTSSFHGTAFAVNYGVPLISIVPGGGDDRQSSLLNRLNLSQCCLKVGEDFSVLNPFYDKFKEQQKMDELRKSSLDWIKASLE